MKFMRAAMNVRLREKPGFSAGTLGEIEQGTVCYTVGGSEVRDDLTWINVVAPTTVGVWYDGWAALSYQDETLLDLFAPSIRLGSPVTGSIPITQLFAENPDTYAMLGYRGHNGLDFGTPVGTPIHAISPGVATHVRSDPRGYGNYVRIDHAWGVSLYAHLSQFMVAEGQTIQGHQVIGLSGNTGFSSGPHLHFEIRVNPTDPNNGFGGRVDPLPYIDRHHIYCRDYVPAALRREIEGE